MRFTHMASESLSFRESPLMADWTLEKFLFWLAGHRLRFLRQSHLLLQNPLRIARLRRNRRPDDYFFGFILHWKFRFLQILWFRSSLSLSDRDSNGKGFLAESLFSLLGSNNSLAHRLNLINYKRTWGWAEILSHFFCRCLFTLNLTESEVVFAVARIICDRLGDCGLST
jgi:hypothetical protein